MYEKSIRSLISIPMGSDEKSSDITDWDDYDNDADRHSSPSVDGSVVFSSSDVRLHVRLADDLSSTDVNDDDRNRTSPEQGKTLYFSSFVLISHWHCLSNKKGPDKAFSISPFITRRSYGSFAKSLFVRVSYILSYILLSPLGLSVQKLMLISEFWPVGSMPTKYL